MEFTEKQQSQLINQFIDNTKESKLVAQAALSATSTEFLMSVRKNPNTSNLNYTDIISTEIHKEKMKLVDQDKQVSYTDLPESEKEKNRVLAREITALVENMKKEDEIFRLDKKTEAKLIEEIKKFFKEVRDEEISDFEGTLVLDFFREKIASEFYNIGVSAAYRRLHEISEDILSILKY